MFGRIKDRLKGIFEKSEEIVEENPDEEIEVEGKKEVIEKKEDKKPAKPKEEKPKKEKKEKKEEEPPEEPEPEPPKEPETLEEPQELEKETKELQEEEKPEEKKKGFFSRVFGKKDEEELKQIEDLQDDMLEGAPEEEKKAIKEHTELKDVEKNKAELESKIEKEELVEKEELEELGEKEEEKESGFFSRTFTKLKSKKITEEDFEKIWIELELFLLEINIAYEIVEKIESKLRDTLIGNSFSRFGLSESIRKVLIEEVEKVLNEREADFLTDIRRVKEENLPVSILVLGVNGTGKTTTIAKVVKYLRHNGLSVVVAAADTFRAAAVEQLDEHSKRLDFKLIKHKGGSDPAAVAFDAIDHAKARKIDVVLIDTAGRMPNNANLMMELQKVKKVSKAQMAIFIGDSISGNDLLDQIELFDKGVEINGVILTKVDTDEKPGSIVTTAYGIEKPIYFLGNGQGYDDLVKFDSKHIAEQLFDIESNEEDL